jgi:CBS domain-containing protein
MLIEHILVETNDRPVISIGPEATVREALHLLVQHRIGSLPILDPEGKLVGIFTERDVLYGECTDPRHFPRRLIKEVMTPAPIVCSPADSVQEAIETMSRHKIGHLPVVVEGRLVGLVSVADLVKSLHGQAEADKEHLIAYIHGPT